MAPPPASHVRKEPIRDRSKLGVKTMAKAERTALGLPVTTSSCTRLSPCKGPPSITAGVLSTMARGRTNPRLIGLPSRPATCPGSSPLARTRGKLDPGAAHAPSSCLWSPRGSRLVDPETKLTSLRSLQKPLCPLLALLISREHKGLGMGHICEPDGTTVGEG